MSESEFNAIMNKQVEQIRASIPVRHMNGAVTDKDGNIIQFTTPGIPRMGLQSMANRLAGERAEDGGKSRRRRFKIEDLGNVERPSKGTKRKTDDEHEDAPYPKYYRFDDFGTEEAVNRNRKLRTQPKLRTLSQNKTGKATSSKMNQGEIDRAYYALSEEEKEVVRGEVGYALLAWAHDAVKKHNLKPSKPWTKNDTRRYATLVQQFRRRGVMLYLNGDGEVSQWVRQYQNAEWGDRNPNASKFDKCKNSRATKRRKAFEAKRAARKARKAAIETACGQYREPRAPRRGKDMTFAENNWDRLARGNVRKSMANRVADARTYYEERPDEYNYRYDIPEDDFVDMSF